MEKTTTDMMKSIEVIRQVLADRREKEKKVVAVEFDGVPNNVLANIVRKPTSS